jgi:hypothetical protein
MVDSDDIKDEMSSGEAGGIGGGWWLDGRCRGTLAERRLDERPGIDLRRLEVFASCVAELLGMFSRSCRTILEWMCASLPRARSMCSEVCDY